MAGNATTAPMSDTTKMEQSNIAKRATGTNSLNPNTSIPAPQMIVV
jgi:hypothetical protein